MASAARLRRSFCNASIASRSTLPGCDRRSCRRVALNGAAQSLVIRPGNVRSISLLADEMKPASGLIARGSDAAGTVPVQAPAPLPPSIGKPPSPLMRTGKRPDIA